MIKKITSFYLCFLAFQMVNASTVINSGPVKGKWTKSQSPYFIKGNISVPKDSTLIIESGVQVRFDGKFKMAVYGKIKAIGKVNDSIRFYSGDTMNRWTGIRYFGTKQVKDSASFLYCIFEQAGPKITNFDCALHLTKGHFNINNCTFRNNRSSQRPSCLLADSVLSLNISDCYFYRNKNVNTDPSLSSYGVGGPLAITNGKVLNCIFKENISKNSFYNQDAYSSSGSGGILYLSDYSEPDMQVTIQNCEFTGNSVASHGAGITAYIRKNGKLNIKDCRFTDNFSGMGGCVSFLGENFSPKASYKMTIEGCLFSNNRSANSYQGPGTACIIATNYKTIDSLIIKGNVFEKSIGLSNIYIIGQDNSKDFYILGNVFRNNLSNSIISQYGERVVSMNNLHYNNLACNYTYKNPEFYSINDAYLYNGPKTDTLALPQKLMINAPGTFYLFTGGNFHDADNGGYYRNCIFWKNYNGRGRLEHLVTDAGIVSEMSNCIFSGDKDSVFKWGGSAGTKPSKLFTLFQANLSADPLFINEPSTYGPDVNTSGLDFHVKNSCLVTSPVYNAGNDKSYVPLTGYDFEDNPRVTCELIDIGPYELNGKKRQAELTTEPSDNGACPGSGFSLYGAAACGIDLQYIWQKKNNAGVWGTINGAVTRQYSGFVSDSGAYRLIVKQPECLVYDTSRIVRVIQYPVPNPSLGKDTLLKYDGMMVLDAGIGVSYLWNTGDTIKAVTVDGNKLQPGKYKYHVTVKNIYGCTGSDTLEVSIDKKTGIEDLAKAGWNLFPNPAVNEITIQSNDQVAFDWYISDMNGKIVKSGTEDIRAVIDIAGLFQGYYFVHLTTKKTTQVVKIYKQADK